MDRNSMASALAARGQNEGGYFDPSKNDARRGSQDTLDNWADRYAETYRQHPWSSFPVGGAKMVGDRIVKPIQYIQNTGGLKQAYNDLFNPTQAEKLGMQTQNIQGQMPEAKADVAESLSRLGRSQGALNDLISQVKANQSTQDEATRTYAQSH